MSRRANFFPQVINDAGLAVAAPLATVLRVVRLNGGEVRSPPPILVNVGDGYFGFRYDDSLPSAVVKIAVSDSAGSAVTGRNAVLSVLVNRERSRVRDVFTVQAFDDSGAAVPTLSVLSTALYRLDGKVVGGPAIILANLGDGDYAGYAMHAQEGMLKLYIAAANTTGANAVLSVPLLRSTAAP